ncbi:hypothetical protein ACJJTC_011256 [Scirpophaga incertulas]
MKLRTSRQYRPVVIQSGNIRVPPPSQSSPASSLVRPAEGPSHRSPLAPSASAPITNSGTPLLHEEQNVSQTESKQPASPLLSALPEHTRGRSDDALEGEYIAIADRRPRRNIRRPDRYNT